MDPQRREFQPGSFILSPVLEAVKEPLPGYSTPETFYIKQFSCSFAVVFCLRANFGPTLKEEGGGKVPYLKRNKMVSLTVTVINALNHIL